MKDTKFTPGPWKVGERGDLTVYSVGDRFIATCGYSNNANPKAPAENKANAALVAAAPELYAAAVAYLGTTPREAYHEQDDAEYQMARNALLNALAKARGEMTAQQILEREG